MLQSFSSDSIAKFFKRITKKATLACQIQGVAHEQLEVEDRQVAPDELSLIAQLE